MKWKLHGQRGRGEADRAARKQKEEKEEKKKEKKILARREQNRLAQQKHRKKLVAVDIQAGIRDSDGNRILVSSILISYSCSNKLIST